MTPRTMLDGYLAAALDTGTDGQAGEIRLSELFTVSDFDRESIVKAEATCDTFRRRAESLLYQSGLTAEEIGRALWMVQSEHAPGYFWRLGLPQEVADGLTEMAERMDARDVVRCRDYLHLVGA